MSDIDDLIRELEEKLKKAKEKVDDQQGPLTGDDLTFVEEKLDDSMSNIEDAKNTPELSGITGQVNSAVNPTTLPDIASDTHHQSSLAVTEITQGSPSYQTVANLLATTEDLIVRSPNGYRRKAGIT